MSNRKPILLKTEDLPLQFPETKRRRRTTELKPLKKPRKPRKTIVKKPTIDGTVKFMFAVQIPSMIRQIKLKDVEIHTLKSRQVERENYEIRNALDAAKTESEKLKIELSSRGTVRQR